MSSKQLLRLALVLAFVLVLWGAVALASRRTEGESGGGSIIPRVDTSKVDTVAIVGPEDTAVLVRTKEKLIPWRVNGYPADTQVVRELLEGLAGAGTSSELVARNPASHARLRVTEDSGKRVRVVEKGRGLLNLVAGKQAPNGEGIYIRRVNDPAVYAMGGQLATALARRGEDWRNHLIGGVPPDSVGAVEIRRGRSSYTLRRDSSGWRFASGAAADSTAVAALLSSYREIRATGFSSKSQLDSLRFARPRRSARLLGRSGTPLLSVAFDSIASGVWVQVTRADRRAGEEAEHEAFRLDSWTADQLTPADSSLRKK